MAKTTTSSSRVGDTLSSHRLQTIQSEYQTEKHVWDIGCDHGLLGLSFKDTETVETIHLVDPSKPVIDVLINKVKDSYISKPTVYIQNIKGQDIQPDSLSNCIFIAGMGGKEIGEIIESILPKLSSEDRIVISPHRKILELRAKLHEMPLSLVREQVIKEDDQYYQILTLKPESAGNKVSLYGESIWNSVVGKEYLKHQLAAFSTHKDGTSVRFVEFLKLLNI